MTTNTIDQTANGVTRRSFIKLGLGALSALAALEMGAAGLAFMAPREGEGQFGGPVDAGTVDSFATASITAYGDGRFYLVRSTDGGFLAVYQRCTHLGCIVSWQEEQMHFFCPCHASTFNEQGGVVNPPAPRPLDTFPVEIVNGRVIVDTSQTQRRESVAVAQLVYA